MRFRSKCAAASGVLCLLALCASSARAQFPEVSQGRFSISGRVVYEVNNKSADLVPVTLRNFTGMTMQQTSTDTAGNFTFQGLSRGVYYVHVSLHGHAEASERIEIITSSYYGLIISLRPHSDPIAPRAVSVPRGPVPAEYLKVPERAREEYEKGLKEFLQNNNLQTALVSFQKALEHHAEFAAAHYWLGMVRLDLGEFEEARRNFSRAIELNQKFAPAFPPLGALHIHFRDYEKAVATLQAGLALNAQSWQGHFELARAYWGQEKFEDAERSALKARELKPDFPRVHLLLANIYLSVGKESEAIESAEAFLALAQNDPLEDEVRRTLAELKKKPEDKP